MPGKILGLDISKDSITAVQVQSGLKVYQITACASVMLEENGGMDGAVKALIDQMDLESDTCFASIPEESCSYRNLQMPFKDPRKIRQTIPYEIESMLPVSVDALLIDFTIVNRADQNEILAVSVEKSYISEYLAQLQNHGVDPDVLDIRCVPIVSWLFKQEGIPGHGLFLDIGQKKLTMILYVERHIVLIRTFVLNGSPVEWSISDAANGDNETQKREDMEAYFGSFCTTVRNTIHAFGCQSSISVRPQKILFTGTGALWPDTSNLLNKYFDIPAEQVNVSRDKRVSMDENISRVWNPALMDGALALALRDARKGQGFNFRKDEFEIRNDYFGFRKDLRKIAAFLIVILSFVAVDLGVDYYFLTKKYRMLDQDVTAVFRQVFPNVTRIVDPLQQMKVKISEIKKSTASAPGISSNNKVLDLLRDISERVPKSLDVNVSRMVIDMETVRLSGETDTFNTVDNIKNKLEPSTYFSSVTISSANLDSTGKRVRFEIKLQLRK
jgi:Tfp pilus assembly PilM family ATPase